MQDPAAGRRGGFREHVEGLRAEHPVGCSLPLVAGTRSALTLDRLQGTFVFAHFDAADSTASHARHSLQSLSLLIRDHQ